MEDSPGRGPAMLEGEEMITYFPPPFLPVTVTTPGEFGALWEKLMLAFTVVFFAVGLNVMGIDWLAPGAIEALEEPTVSPDELDWMLLIVSVAVPPLVTTTVVVALAPIATPPKS